MVELLVRIPKPAAPEATGVHRRAAKVAKAFSVCGPIVRGDWTTRRIPLGMARLHLLLWHWESYILSCSGRTFYLAASHRQIKTTSLRPLCLCGENPILDRQDGIGKS
jgi:hypothetical protein